MKRNPDFLMREVADTVVVVPVGAASASFPGMITLNASGAFLWEQLAQEQSVDTLVAALLEQYEVTEAMARTDVEKFLEKLMPTGAILA